MLKVLCGSLIQCAFLAAGQIFLKFGLEKIDKFSWTLKFFKEFFTNWWLLSSGLSMVAATIVWFYLLKHNDLSLVYPLISMSYVFGTIAAIYFFHETVSPVRWLGVLFIMIGVAFLVRS